MYTSGEKTPEEPRGQQKAKIKYTSSIYCAETFECGYALLVCDGRVVQHHASLFFAEIFQENITGRGEGGVTKPVTYLVRDTHGAESRIFQPMQLER